MRAVRIDGPGELCLVELPEPEPGPAEVLVTVAYAGICGSDVDLLSGSRPADFVSYPVVPGHEWSGMVTGLGPDVDVALLGRKVVGEGLVGCLSCAMCRDGEKLLCSAGYDELGFTRPGAWAQRMVVPAASLHPLAEEADLRAAAGLEPAACAAEAVSVSGVGPGDRVAVVGAGTIGVLAVQLLRARGLAELVVVEPDQRRAELAVRCGATETWAPEQAERGWGRFDVVVEAAGATTAAETSAQLSRRGGTVVLAGIPDSAAVVSVALLVANRLTVRTVFGASSRAWREAVTAFDEGILDPQLLVTHELDLASAREALDLLSSRRPEVGKVLLRP